MTRFISKEFVEECQQEKRKEPREAASYCGKATSGRSDSGVRAGIRSLIHGVATPLHLRELPILVALYLALQLVHELVDGGVHVFTRLLDEDVTILDVKRYFGIVPSPLLTQLLEGEEDVDVYHLVEMPRDAV
jgi:hypothetical protein